jgi:Flp pilus assembly protein TadG
MPPHFTRLTAAVRRLARAQGGATAVEFAIIATPFFLLLMGILELALVFLVSTTLEHATQEASRQLRTGEFQMAGKVNEDDFETMICDSLAWIGDTCKAQLDVDSRAYGTLPLMLAGLTANPYDPDDRCFEAGGPGQVVLVRASIEWKIFTPLLRPAMGATSEGKRYIRTTTAFKNEPFPDDPPADVCAT